MGFQALYGNRKLMFPLQDYYEDLEAVRRRVIDAHTFVLKNYLFHDSEGAKLGGGHRGKEGRALVWWFE